MDRARAYKLLITEMESVSSRSSNELSKLTGKAIETEVTSESGELYSVSVSIKSHKENNYIIEGSIHNNNSFKYELLEERMVVNK